MNVRALGDPMKLALSIWYEYNHNGVDSGRCGRARWVHWAGREGSEREERQEKGGRMHSELEEGAS